jgi:NitT/TauT family transport system substrate-binding protein
VFKEGTVALQRGLPYARILEKKYGFDHVKIVPSPGGDISAFLHDEMFAQQCFVMSEPLGAKRNGVAVKVFPVADAGYNPYTTVLATSGDMLKRDAEKVRSMVAAAREGWRIYLDNPMSTNEKMHELNPTLDNNTIAEVAEAQKSYIETDETRTSGLGFMTLARWETLVMQLKDLGDIPQAVVAQDCFKLV